jgi:charged multivesicular body protein 3
MVKVTGAFQKSTEIMKSTNQLVKLPQLSATMRQMSMEMMKVGTTPCHAGLFLANIPVWHHGRDDGGDARRTRRRRVGRRG